MSVISTATLREAIYVRARYAYMPNKYTPIKSLLRHRADIQEYSSFQLYRADSLLHHLPVPGCEFAICIQT